MSYFVIFFLLYKINAVPNTARISAKIWDTLIPVDPIIRESVLNPSSQVYYASFYIQGLYDSIGKPNISFSAKYFKDLRRNEGRTAYDVYFAFVLINDGVITKYVIDFADDASDINRSAYKWADIYAKVNINKSFTLFYAYNKIVDYNRIIQLPPYFGIKIWNSYQTIFYCITNYIKSLSNRSVGIHVHIKDYLLQYVHRSRLSYYETPSLKNNGNNYVFFLFLVHAMINLSRIKLVVSLQFSMFHKFDAKKT